MTKIYQIPPAVKPPAIIIYEQGEKYDKARPKPQGNHKSDHAPSDGRLYPREVETSQTLLLHPSQVFTQLSNLIFTNLPDNIIQYHPTETQHLICETNHFCPGCGSSSCWLTPSSFERTWDEDFWGEPSSSCVKGPSIPPSRRVQSVTTLSEAASWSETTAKTTFGRPPRSVCKTLPQARLTKPWLRSRG